MSNGDHQINLDDRRIRERAGSTLQQSYFMLVSILQGVAIYMLIDQSVDSLKSVPPATVWVSTLSRALLLFMVIAQVTFQYTWISIWGTRMPSPRDTVLPLSLGAAEILSVRLISYTTAFWVAFTVFLIVANIAWWSTRSRLANEPLGSAESEVISSIRAYSLISKISLLVSGLAMVSVLLCIFAPTTDAWLIQEWISIGAQIILTAACGTMFFLATKSLRLISGLLLPANAAK